MMSRLLVSFAILSVYLVSCTKSEPGQSGNEQPYNGQWQWIRTSSGPFNTRPLADSPVILSLKPDNSYDVTLSGLLKLRGTYTTDSSTSWNNIKFNNITLPAGDTTTVTRGNITEIYFNYSQIGRLVIFQNNEMTISGDTLTLIRTPITPETPVSSFKRIGN